MQDIDEISLLQIITKFVAALRHVHQNGFVHNDLKVDNVALMRVNEASGKRVWIPIILDFGEATKISISFKRQSRPSHVHIDPAVSSKRASS